MAKRETRRILSHEILKKDIMKYLSKTVSIDKRSNRISLRDVY